MGEVIPKLNKIEKEFNKQFDRNYFGPLDLYKSEDAEIILIVAGTIAGTVKQTVDELRSKGIKVGVIRLRVFRPFPAEEFKNVLKNSLFVGVLDRSFSFGYEGQIYSELKASLYASDINPLIKNYIVGIGGRDVTIETIKHIFENCEKCLKNKKVDYNIEWTNIKVKS